MSTETDTEQAAESNEQELPVSKLTTGRERFLACVVEQAIAIGARTPGDFIRHFPPNAIMAGLQNEPERRANILVLTTGTKQRIALKKSWESCAEDLQIALEEGETDADTVVTLLDLDDRVRFLDDHALWAFVTETKFWMSSPSREAEFTRSKAFMVFVINRALEDRLLTHQDVVNGVTVDELAKRLPKPELGKIIQQALENAHGKMPFTEMDLLRAMPVASLVDFVPLTHLWDKVVVPKVSERHNYVESRPAPEASSVDQAVPESGPEPVGADDVVAYEEEPTESRISIADELDILEVQSDAEPVPEKPALRRPLAKPKSADSSDGWSALDRRGGAKRPMPKPKASNG